MAAAAINSLTFDARDPWTIAAFWAAVLGRAVAADDVAGDPEVLLAGEPDVLFLAVPEGKTAKNRLHLDIEAPPGSTREAEVERVLALGATQTADFRRPDGTGFVVFTDPEGNEFCVVRNAEERAATGD